MACARTRCASSAPAGPKRTRQGSATWWQPPCAAMVFDTLAENAVRLCEAEHSLVCRFDGQLLRGVAVHNTSAELAAFIDQKTAGGLYRRHQSGIGRHGNLLWALLVLGRWAEKWS